MGHFEFYGGCYWPENHSLLTPVLPCPPECWLVPIYLPEYNVWHPRKLDKTLTTMTATNLKHFEICMELPTTTNYEYFKCWQCPIYSNTMSHHCAVHNSSSPAGHWLHFYNKVTLQLLANSTRRITTHVSGK